MNAFAEYIASAMYFAEAFFEKIIDKYPIRVYSTKYKNTHAGYMVKIQIPLNQCKKREKEVLEKEQLMAKKSENRNVDSMEIQEEGMRKVCPCCEKHTARSEEERKKLINRLKRVEGQIRGIIRLLENDAYCNDILIQSAAVNAAVNAFNKELLAQHIRTCVARDIRQGKDETIDELVATLQKLMK